MSATNDIPYGYCHCGCGQKTRLATNKDDRYGHVKGQPVRFVNGHVQARPYAERLAQSSRPADDLSPNGMAGCIVWTGRTDDCGYGTITVDGKELKAHTAALKLAGIATPAGREADHLCRRRNCVNVDHLELVTHAENMRRSAKAKLSQEQAAEVHYLRNAGWNAQAIAGAYGISRNHVYKLAGGYCWDLNAR